MPSGGEADRHRSATSPPSGRSGQRQPTSVQPLRVVQIADLPPETDERPAWLIEEIWAREAVGLIGGAPKSCKTYLALEMALAVASGAPCLGRFAVHEPGPVLLFAAEDAPAQVRDRLDGLARARGVAFERLPVFLVLAEQLRLDTERDLARLRNAIERHRPRLLILDPFVRLHTLDENSATEVSRLLADLRALQRRFQLAVLLVHHTRKGSGPVSGQALRGSSDLHAWGDSNLYLKKASDHRATEQASTGAIRLTVEHRAARTPEPITLALTGDPLHLKVTASPTPSQPLELDVLILRTLSRHSAPKTQAQLRAELKVRNQVLTNTLRHLQAQSKVTRTNGGWALMGRPDPQADAGPLFTQAPA